MSTPSTPALTSNGGEITASLDQRLLQFETTLGDRVMPTLDSFARQQDQVASTRSIDGPPASRWRLTFDTRAKSVTETIDGRLGTLARPR